MRYGMGLISKLLGGGLTKTITTVADTVDDYVYTEEERATLQQAIDQGQLKVNVEEAKHRSMFVAGWRPFIGWICGVGLLYSYVLVPIATALGMSIENDRDGLMALTTAMLGLGGMRTYEKMKGVTK